MKYQHSLQQAYILNSRKQSKKEGDAKSHLFSFKVLVSFCINFSYILWDLKLILSS